MKALWSYLWRSTLVERLFFIDKYDKVSDPSGPKYRDQYQL